MRLRIEVLLINLQNLDRKEAVDLVDLWGIQNEKVVEDMKNAVQPGTPSNIEKQIQKVLSSYAEEQLHFEKINDSSSDQNATLAASIFSQVPNVAWHEIVGHKEIKQTLKEMVVWPRMYPEVGSFCDICETIRFCV